MPLVNKLKKSVKAKPVRRGPLWTGPSGEGPMGGVTQGLIGRWLCCRERFRLMAIEGLKPEPEFSPRLHYGQMWHTCEESHAIGQDYKEPLKTYCKLLIKEFPTQSNQIEHWYRVCLVQFPIYVKWWDKHRDVKNRTPLLQETAFDVPYTLPSGRVVRLRGKWDAVDLIGG